ncbi:MAG: UV DNA damage repair endonuclease UvsE [Anaerolineae bacterium]|nr:UV DNA damage repair endonuclease UvsE [Anaerolineae bacterium]
MRIGYPTVNNGLGCTSAKTFRLASFSEERFYDTLGNNLICLLNTLAYNQQHRILYFRLASEIVPFASHPVCQLPWQNRFHDQFAKIGAFARQYGMRFALHPGQYTLINSPDERVLQNTIAELIYQTELLDLMGIDATHKVQIHVGGVYNDKDASITRFIQRYRDLPAAVQRRLVIENDDRLYSVGDCVRIHEAIGIPIVFDNLHHELLNNGESLGEGFERACKTWSSTDGLPMVDYSSQAPGKRIGTHRETIDLAHFVDFLNQVDGYGYDIDIMIEIKDKEQSVLPALAYLQEQPKT